MRSQLSCFDLRAVSRCTAFSWESNSSKTNGSSKPAFIDATLRRIACFIVCLLFSTLIAAAQGVGTSGEITGTVTDSAGSVVLKAAVSVVDAQTGLKRTTTTDSTGQFRVAGLSPATYDVSVEMSGFATEIRKNVIVDVGQTVISDFKLNLSKVATIVEVTGQPPVVETERGSQADTIIQQYIADLPVDRRDYLTFTLLAPGVSDSTRLAGDQDFRVKQTPQSGLSFYGSNGRGNNITIDGGETSGDSGGVRLTVNQDDVQEFQINRSNYGADLGAATGASINIVTKSGNNDVHGTLYGFFRNDALDARDPFAFSSALSNDPTYSNFNTTSTGAPIKNSLSRQQYGGNIGFPISKDKTFFFASFEGLRQNSQNSVPILTDSSIFAGPSATATSNPFSQTDPRYAQQQIVSALAINPALVPCLAGLPDLPGPECAFALQGLLSISPTSPSNPFVTPGQTALNAYLVTQFESQGGVFAYNTREYLASTRLDHHFNSTNELSLTYRYGHDLEESPDVQSLTAYSAGSSIHTYDNNFQAAWYHQFSPRAQNEARVQWDYNSFNVIPNEPAQAGLQIPGFINNIGTNIFLPNITILRRYEFADNFTIIRGHHTFKFGGYELLRGNHTESHTFFPGRWVFGALPGVALSPQLAGATLDSLQGAGLGLPEIYQQGFGDPTYGYYARPLTAFYAQDSWKMTSNFTLNYGLRYEIDTQFAPLTTYYKDFGPRVSFAWDPFNDHKTVIRGGYGIFYGPVDAQIPDVDLSLGVVGAGRAAVENSTGAGQVANVTAICGVSQFGTTIIPGIPNSICNREISIYADGISGVPLLGIAGAATMFQTLFGEGLIQCTTPTAGNNACVTPAAVAGPFAGSQPVGIDVTNNGPLSPLQVLFVNQPGYRPPIAQQASFGIEREIGPGFSISLSGIYTHTQRLPVAIDTNLVTTPGGGLIPAPFSTVELANGQTVSYRNWNTSPAADPLGGTEVPQVGGVPAYPCQPAPNVDPCLYNPLIVQNNQYTSGAYAVYEGGIVEVKKRFSDQFTLFGNYTYSKAIDTSTDYNTDYGPQDPTNLNLDRSLSEFDQRHKLVIAGVINSPWRQNYLSGFQLSPIFEAHSGHPFNLLAGGEVNGNNHITNERPIGAPRDTGLGPDYIDFDMRLTWAHKLGEKSNIQFVAEGFNIPNRTNYASVNNEVSPLFGFESGFTTFNVKGIKPGAALAGGGIATSSTPLAFTSAFPKRQVQLGVRFSF
ncbi:MAG: TonB-dependent receptor [Terriglobales bacterium]